MAIRRRRTVGGRKNAVGLRFSDEEFAAISAAAGRAGLSVPNLVATVALEAAADGLSGLDRRVVMEEMAAVRRYLEVCAAGLNGGGADVEVMVRKAVARLNDVLDDSGPLLDRSAAAGVAGPGASGGDGVLGGGVVVVAEGGGDDRGGGLEDELLES